MIEKKLIDYTRSKIYTIKSPNTDKIYIGSTTNTLYKRMCSHIAHSKENCKIKNTSRIIINSGDSYIELLEEYPCVTRQELLKREGELIKQHKLICVNKNIAGRSMKDYVNDNKVRLCKYATDYYKQYNIINKVKVLKQKKEYYLKNKVEILKKQRERKRENKLKQSTK